MTAFDSEWDLRQPWQVEELTNKIRKLLGPKTGKTTRQVADAAKCNHEQARRILTTLWEKGLAVPEGDRRQRMWYRN